MRVVFMGTPAFAVPSLRKLAAAHEVALVLTRPDAVRSRGKKLEPSPVKEAALELGLPVMEANRMTPEVLDALRAAEAEIFCVAAYGCILPDEVLTMAPLGCVNVHASLLPRWRGAAPSSAPFWRAMPRPACPSCVSATAWTRVRIAPRRVVRSPVSPPTS